MTKYKLRFVIVAAATAVFGCGQQKQKSTEPAEGFASGKITILADESFKPVVEQEEKVFESIYAEAKLNVDYRTENELLRSFLNDSTRVAILGRKLTDEETKILESRKLPPIYSLFARDAVALIVNSKSADTLITLGQIKKCLTERLKLIEISFLITPTLVWYDI